MLYLETQSRCTNTMYTNSFCNWSVNHWKLWLKNPVSVKVWLVATRKEKIALKKFLHFMEATNKGVIFRVMYVKDGHFLALLSCTTMCSGNEVASQMVLKTDLSCYHNVKQKLHSCLNRFWFIIIMYILSEFNWQPVPGTSIVVENPSEDSCCS